MLRVSPLGDSAVIDQETSINCDERDDDIKVWFCIQAPSRAEPECLKNVRDGKFVGDGKGWKNVRDCLPANRVRLSADARQ